MDLAEAGAQGLGLALAAGLVFGAAGAGGTWRSIAVALAAAAGAALWGASLGAEDHPAWPGLALGALAGAFACVVVGGLASDARRRAGGAALGVVGMIVLAGLALAGVSLLGAAAFASAAALLALLWIALARRRRAATKHAGLRSLR